MGTGSEIRSPCSSFYSREQVPTTIEFNQLGGVEDGVGVVLDDLASTVYAVRPEGAVGDHREV